MLGLRSALGSATPPPFRHGLCLIPGVIPFTENLPKRRLKMLVEGIEPLRGAQHARSTVESVRNPLTSPLVVETFRWERIL